MPGYATLTFDEYGAGIGAAATVLRANATSTRLDAPVPACPEWTVTDLVVHQGMVHRWATDVLRGLRTDPASYESEGRAQTDLLEWFDDGATALLDVLSKTEEDWDGFFFLDTAPHPRNGWARRQCHETTIHAVDAMSARLGRVPTTDEVWFSRELAVDGIDELLIGFAQRPKTRLRAPEPVVIELVTTDTGHTWTVTVSPEQPIVTPGPADDADARWSGTARDLYLAVWNRGSGTQDSGIQDSGIQIGARTDAGAQARDLWSELFQVRWG